MKSILKTIVFLLMFTIGNCNVKSPCKQLDSSCNLISSLIMEKQIRESTNALTFSPAPGSYKFDQFVTILSNRSSNIIRYTTDGSEPTCSSGTIFSTPVPIIGAKTQTLKAVACTDTTLASSKGGAYTVSVSPLSGQNLRFWYSADSIGTQNGMEVKVWNDYSGNANHLYPSSISLSTPTLTTNALNGKPSVRLNSSLKQFLNTRTMSSYTGTKAGTGTLVFRKYSTQSDEVYFSIGQLGNSTNSRNWKGNLLNPSICSTLPPTAANCGGNAATTVPTTGYHAITFTVDSSGATTYYYDGVTDGTFAVTTLPANFTSANTMFVGTGLNTSTFLDAEILELIFFEQGFDANGVNIVHCMIQNKYGLTIGSNCP